MSGPLHTAEAHLLARQPHAGDHLVLTCFSAADGLFTALLRPPASPRRDAPPAPDLFDHLALVLARPRGGGDTAPWFVREHRVLFRHPALGRDYPTLAAASRLARVVARNPVPAESRAAIHRLLALAFAALARPGARPDLVLFKGLYCLARDEGLPLREHWLPALPAADRDLARVALALPADAADAPPAPDLARLQKRLESYLAAEADLVLD